MQISPRELGTRWHIAVVRLRALGTARITTHPHVGRLGRLWIKGMRHDPDVLAATLPMMADHTGPLVAGMGTLIPLGGATAVFLFGIEPSVAGATIAAVATGLYGSLVAIPRRNFRRLHDKPITWEEIEALKGTIVGKDELKERPARGPIMKMFQNLKGTAPRRQGDQLEREYLSLVQDALTIQGLSGAAEVEVKRVLQSVGDAVGALPPAKTSDEEAADVAGDAEMLAARALREGDAVIAASLLRQADANLARARAIENNKILARRTHILRDEMIAQVRAVRSLLPALASDAATAATDFGRFASVSASVQSIASEAVSVEDARAELARELFPEMYAPALSTLPPVTTTITTPAETAARLELRR